MRQECVIKPERMEIRNTKVSLLIWYDPREHDKKSTHSRTLQQGTQLQSQQKSATVFL